QAQFISTRRALVVEGGFYPLLKIEFGHQLAQKHQPLLQCERIGPQAYKTALFKGFEYAYGALMVHRHAIIEMLEQSAGELTTRVLLKNSQRYADFIGLIRHPRFMQNMLDRELLLATLWKDLKGPYRERGIARYEIADL
ncbi:DUF4135 domain-containing protein, partial [Pseudomonas brassicacearum]|uniref:DUF4135 domain-containing protein n=1 Tax=Pseudomonas brassicacearum TaxID=930166 RepID=UPI000F4AF28D